MPCLTLLFVSLTVSNRHSVQLYCSTTLHLPRGPRAAASVRRLRKETDNAAAFAAGLKQSEVLASGIEGCISGRAFMPEPLATRPLSVADVELWMPRELDLPDPAALITIMCTALLPCMYINGLSSAPGYIFYTARYAHFSQCMTHATAHRITASQHRQPCFDTVYSTCAMQHTQTPSLQT